MKNILLLIHDDAGEEARLQAALDLARALSGHLTCIDVVQMPVLAGSGYMMAEAQQTILTDVRDQEAVNARRIKERLAAEDVPWEWRDTIGGIPELVEAESGLADIIVLNTALAEGGIPDMRAVASGLAIHARKPILAVPEGTRGLDVDGHVLVAWNGSPPAEAALRAVTPLLALAASVTLVELGEIESDAQTAEEAAAYLSRHGIHARIDRSVPLEETIADTLLHLCRKRSPAYCVMGAYGHSRVRESLFGGVTRRMLDESTVPLLIAH